MKITAPIETKVAASTTASLAVTALFALAATYHWFTPPPPQLTGLLITAIIGVAGWLAPHTHLRPEPPAAQFLGQPMTPAEVTATAQLLHMRGVMTVTGTSNNAPAVQPPATTTGATAEGTTP